MPPPFLKQAREVLPPALPVSEASLLQMGTHGSQNNSPSLGSFLWFFRGVDGFFSAHHHTGHCRQFVSWDLWSSNSLICFSVRPGTCCEPAGCETGTLGVFAGWTLSSGPPCSGPASLESDVFSTMWQPEPLPLSCHPLGFPSLPSFPEALGQESLGPGPSQERPSPILRPPFFS